MARRPTILGLLFLAACGHDAAPPAGTTAAASAALSATAPAAASAALSATAPAAASAPSASAPSASAPSASAPSASASAPPAASASAPPHPAEPDPDPDARPLKPRFVADAGAGPADAGAGPTAPAAPPPSQALSYAQQLDRIFVGKKTFSATFKQTFTMKVLGDPKTSTGTVFIERPNKISFRYDAPKKDRIVSDGTVLKIYQADSNQMIETPTARTEFPGAFAFIMGKGISTSFEFSINPRAKWPAGVVLDAKPKTPTPSYETVLFFVDTALLAKVEPGALGAVLLVDAQGNRNRFDFTNVTQPPSIPASEFTFDPPPGTEIKRQ